MVSGPKLYSVPRKLDLASLFVFTTGYGLLFALMNLVHASVLFFSIVAGFFTCVGVSQAALFQGKSPRLASCLTGAAYYFGILLVSGMPLIGTVFVLLVGAAVGYVSGACIGGVFLVADVLRNRLRHDHKLDSEEV